MDFYTLILRENLGYWVALCLENGIVGQGDTKKEAIDKLKEAVSSFELVKRDEVDIYSAPISIKELHEFLSFEDKEALSEPLELRAVHA